MSAPTTEFNAGRHSRVNCNSMGGEGSSILRGDTEWLDGAESPAELHLLCFIIDVEWLSYGGRSYRRIVSAISTKRTHPPGSLSLGFNLLYGNNVRQDYLQRVVEALRPYPRGSSSYIVGNFEPLNVNSLLLRFVDGYRQGRRNPAYDSNTTNIDVINNAKYHGMVVWSGQQGIMAAGLDRQPGYCMSSTNLSVDTNPSLDSTPEWCGNTTFVQSVPDSQARL